ncbi:MAG TPA: homoserine dehydrogenase, partial [Candidatus Thermoplasmatota archaeon]|nr:homoserine dehydrogenase [Candidatus Thermoplasmatota archaeon]
RHVVFAGKGALALHGREVARAAEAAGREARGSATVCGGTPALELLGAAFRGDAVERIEGVLNGSTSFVLSRLEEGDAWDQAIAEARRLGYLEADPSLDLLGLDAAAKAVILANAAWGLGLTLADAKAQGVMGVTAAEARQAKERGLAIRLVARASPGLGVAVAPVALPRDHPLVTDGPENALRLKLRDAGAITLRGRGAGGRETAAAVLSDILAISDIIEISNPVTLNGTPEKASAAPRRAAPLPGAGR